MALCLEFEEILNKIKAITNMRKFFVVWKVG